MFSGIQPSGKLHLGNYLGSIKNWEKLQHQFELPMFCIVDLHAMTVPKNATGLYEAIIETAATYIACGIDVKESAIFVQSAIPEHTQLAWLLSCFAPTSWLNRMTQFKDKSAKDKSLSSLGLYSYPVLMAADVLLYKATHIPVGDDQKQHIELARDIASSFNSFYGTDYLDLPQAVLPDSGSRVMSLRDGKVKMSKSDPSDYSRINLTDEADVIKAKISKAKTDSIIGFEPEGLKLRPEAYNLVQIYSSLSGVSIDSACNELKDFVTLKRRLIDLLISSLENIRVTILGLKKDYKYIHNVLDGGANQVAVIASSNFKKIKKIMGIYN